MGDCICKVSLRLWWEFTEISPQDLSERLGLSAERAWAKGDQRMTPKGNLLSGKWDGSYWYCPLESCSIGVLSSTIEKHVSCLQLHDIFIREFVERGGKFVMFVGFIGDGTFGFNLESKVVSMLASLGANLSIEVYSPIAEGLGSDDMKS